MRRSLALPLVIAAVGVLALAQASLAVGPSLGAFDNRSIANTGSSFSYLVKLAKGGEATVVEQRAHGRTLKSLTLTNGWGIQMAALSGQVTGLSPNGRVLVLSDNIEPNGYLRTSSQFVVVDTQTMKVQQVLRLHGDYSVDALSPDGRLLYLIHHVSGKDLTRYQVVGYDLSTYTMLPGVIADKRQASWIMKGFAISRATTRSGDWVYTFYQENDNYPFVHALDAANHTAVCIGIPASWVGNAAAWISSAHLSLANGKLVISTRDGDVRYLMDTTTFQVSTP